jgi:preprotein translocase subunit SecA
LLLESISTHWVDHLTHMENLRTGVGLHAVGQRDPLTVYRTEGQRAFNELMRHMQREVTHRLFHVTLAPEAAARLAAANSNGVATDGAALFPDVASTNGTRGNNNQQPPVNGARSPRAQRGGRKIGRNSQCPCGSGRKYKRCCGAAA